MKKFLCRVMQTLVLFVFLTGCPEVGTKIIGSDNSSVLINSVWVGETPRSGDWLTIAFKSGKNVIMSFSFDNTSNNWNYTFDDKNHGTITNPEGGWSPAPNGFTINGNTLTITNYGGHVTSRDFKRVRQADLTVDPVPFTLEDLNSNLINSVWAGTAPRPGDWLTITFKSDKKVIWSFSIDNTTNEWEFTFDEAANEGTITNPEGNNPAPDGFTINDEGDVLTITNFFGHGGASREFKRYR
jgi:hypothetical protein